MARLPFIIVRENESAAKGSSTSVHKTGSPSDISTLALAPRRREKSDAGTFRRLVPAEGTALLDRFSMVNVAPVGIGFAATTISVGAAFPRMALSTAEIRCLATMMASIVRSIPAMRGRKSVTLFVHLPDVQEVPFVLFQKDNGCLPSVANCPDANRRCAFLPVDKRPSLGGKILPGGSSLR